MKASLVLITIMVQTLVTSSTKGFQGRMTNVFAGKEDELVVVTSRESLKVMQKESQNAKQELTDGIDKCFDTATLVAVLMTHGWGIVPFFI